MNRRIGAVALPGLLAAVLATTPAIAQGDPQLPIPGVNHRPATRLETDFYAYGPGVGFSEPELMVDLDPNGYSEAVTLFLYWQDREGGNATRLYYNAHDGFGTQARDLLSATTTAARLFVPALSGFKFFGDGGAFGPLPNDIPTTTGRYMFVFEVRDEDATAVISRSVAMYNHVDGVVSRSGDITTQTWSRNNLYRLAAAVNVQSGSVLTIEPGTVVIGSKGGQGTLVGLRGSRIVADGTLWNPIVFTSEFEVGTRESGDWGGLVMSGSAPANCSATAAGCAGEGNSGNFGGDDPASNCGTVRYVRVEFAGIRFSEQNELNGIAFQGCGTGTTIEKVQISNAQDDGFEMFGGTANAKHILVFGAEDDNLDWVNGWVGKVQFFVAIQKAIDGNNGIEADNLGANNDALPRSNPTVANLTFIGNRGRGPIEPGSAMLLRVGTAGTIRNVIAQSFPKFGLEVVGTVSEGQLGNTLTVNGGMFFDNPGPGDDTLANDYIGNAANLLRTDNPLLANPLSTVQPDAAPLPGSPARNVANAAATPADPFFVNAPFLGGVDPQNNWTFEGWINYADN
jgi:hypothetical protein